MYIPNLASLVPSLVGAFANAFAEPGDCAGACTNVRDPSVIQRADGKYFRFSTSNKILSASANSLEGPWTAGGSAIEGGSKIDIPGKNILWAPDVHKVGDDYYMYYSVSTLGSQTSAIGVAVSKDMSPGSWEDLGSAGITSSPTKNYNAIDSSLIQANGKIYMIFGSFWGGIFQVEMHNPPTSPISDPVNLAYEPQDNHPIEGASIFQHGDWFYLFYSHGKCCKFDPQNLPPPGGEYKIKVCRSKRVDGGFVDQAGVDCTKGGGTIILQTHGNIYAPGGQSVFVDDKRGPVLYYHYLKRDVGYANEDKFLGWNVINWDGGWPSV
ncbi:hypothetical protein FQN54_002948 [Arachnomyces sp. PD_36]|nr:hypothetical protein FQN54_002948 [Arachnomyces sp. PD_36]